MTKKCKIYVLTFEGPVEAGHVTLSNGNLTASHKPGYEILMSNISSKFPKERKEEWLDKLPSSYTGTYMWAEKG